MGVRYRVGLDRATGRPLVGWPHCHQSMEVILTTLLGERVMELEFGTDIVGKIGRNLVAPVVLAIYRDAVVAIHKWEPEYRCRRVQLIRADRTGALRLAMFGDYYPEGRLGNYGLVESRDGTLLVQAGAVGSVAA